MVKGRITRAQVVAGRCVVTLETTDEKGTQTKTLSFKAGTEPAVAEAMVRAEIDDANEAERLDGLRKVFEAHIAKGTVFGEDTPPDVPAAPPVTPPKVDDSEIEPPEFVADPVPTGSAS